MVENYDIADKLEGPMYDAAVQAASYWRDAVKDIDKNLAVLQGDNDKYVEGLRKAAAAAAHAAKEEQRLAEKRDRIRAGYADDVRGYEFSQKLEQLRGGAETKGMSKDELEGRVSQARGEYNAELYELNELRKEAIASANPEDY